MIGVTERRRAAARRAADVTDRALRSNRWRPIAGRPSFEAKLVTARILRSLDRARDDRIDVSRPGRALLASAPDAIDRLATRLPRGSVVVSGTNGKTTITAMTAGIVARAGWRPVTNRVGANMAGGVAAALAEAARAGGRMAGSIGVFELDELWLGRVAPRLQPGVVVLANLFRDQLDRMGELDTITARWERMLDEMDTEATVVLCADDARVASLAGGRTGVVTFGLEDVELDRATLPSAADRPRCTCGARIALDRVLLGHLGHWHCPACGRARPRPDVYATDVRLRGLDGSSFTLHTPGGEASVELRVPGIYNVSNALAASAAAHALGISPALTARALDDARSVFGRAEELRVDGSRFVVLLMKNPTGADEVLRVLEHEAAHGPLDLLALLNDNDLDGRDVSWIWDADFERLAGGLRRVTCAGTRAADLALRLRYAGVPADRLAVCEPVEVALGRSAAEADGNVVVLANYTAMLEVRELVAEQRFADRYWR